jgi:hypothetical protein
MAGAHVHKNLSCVECGVVIYKEAMCILWRGEEYCILPQLTWCESCLHKEKTLHQEALEGK